MLWEFTPEEVVKGEVAYGIQEFRADLYQEVAANTAGILDADGTRACFDVVYDYVYWMATGRKPDEFTLMDGAPVDRTFLNAIREPVAPNVIMLGAILQRMIMDGIEEGLSVDEAVAAAARRHESAVGEPNTLGCV